MLARYVAVCVGCGRSVGGSRRQSVRAVRLCFPLWTAQWHSFGQCSGGRQLSHREAINRGSADRPLTNHDISDKYFINAKRALPESRAAQIRETVLSLERLEAAALHALLAEPI